MKKLILGLLAIGLTSQVFSQVINLPEIEITAVNYKYLNAVESNVIDVDVKMLQEKVAMFDLKSSEFYEDEYSTYEVRFYIPNGTIVAAYDGKGRILRTIERFKDVQLPKSVRESIAQRFPGWAHTKDVYLVSYHNKKGVERQEYKVILENGDKTMKVKVDAVGNFM